MSEQTAGIVSQPYYTAVLKPHRSLPPRGFAFLMLALGGASVCISLAFVLRGAWPVTPFFGLDVALVYLAFRLSYRQARQREELRLTDDSLTVDRVSIYGERRRWQFQPFWLRVRFEEKDEHTSRLTLTSHGRSLVVGSFLGPEERRGVARGLSEALARWRRHISPRL
ncbi:MAG TPA: DUF2244 domain-containing protein [Stellaceae bacterium]|nr:DUF2244 domain-containing protein [Stellaceae bacterium]